MNSLSARKEALGVLRGILAKTDKDGELKTIIEAKDEVIGRYQPVFSPENAGQITADEFKSFLLFKNNKHWSGLHRQGNMLTSDMPRLREALSIIVDELRPIEDRLDQIVSKSGQPYVKHLGKAVVTAILHVTYPDKYGVYNGTSETAMAELGLWPEFDRGATFRERYLKVNQILNELADALGIDLWTLDSLWWRVKRPENGTIIDRPISDSDEEAEPYRFGLEQHLHDFMRDNWQAISLSKEWDLYEQDGEIVGDEYDTKEIGRIDLLAHHNKDDRWLVVELKRNQTCDDTVGQVLRYMGWVRAHLANPEDKVEGLIVAHEPDPRLRYALQMTDGVKLMLYKVDFQLDYDHEL